MVCSAAMSRGTGRYLKSNRGRRAATRLLFEGFDPAMIARSGTANGNRISVLSLGWTIAGHAEHHVRILRERYLPQP